VVCNFQPGRACPRKREAIPVRPRFRAAHLARNGSGAWTRTRIARSKVWSATDCTTPEWLGSQDLAVSIISNGTDFHQIRISFRSQQSRNVDCSPRLQPIHFAPSPAFTQAEIHAFLKLPTGKTGPLWFFWDFSQFTRTSGNGKMRGSEFLVCSPSR
jgi:hypothetical protein